MRSSTKLKKKRKQKIIQKTARNKESQAGKEPDALRHSHCKGCAVTEASKSVGDNVSFNFKDREIPVRLPNPRGRTWRGDFQDKRSFSLEEENSEG